MAHQPGEVRTQPHHNVIIRYVFAVIALADALPKPVTDLARFHARRCTRTRTRGETKKKPARSGPLRGRPVWGQKWASERVMRFTANSSAPREKFLSHRGRRYRPDRATSARSSSKMLSRSSALDVRLGPIAASREFVVPATVLVLPGDARGLARHDLLPCRAFRSSVGLIMGGEGLGEDVAHLVGPSAVMFDDLVADLGHEWLLCRSNQSLEPSEKVAAKSGGNILASSDGG